MIGIRAETALHCFMLLDHTAELREIAKQIAREAPGAAPGRVEAYEADAFLCPNCWVAQGARSQLFFIVRGNRRQASLRRVSLRIRRVGAREAVLLQRDLHRVEVEGHGKRLEEIMAYHAGEVEAEHVFPWERSVVETLNIVFPHVPVRQLAHRLGHDLQLSAAP